MTLVFLLIALVPALAAVVVLASTISGLVRLPLLGRVPCPERERWPSLTIVSPACNEEKHVQSAVASMLALDYPDVRVVAVDDRSTDSTGALLDALAKTHDRLTVLHLTELPDGWLGKLNALEKGVAQATGDWLLFMDADAHLSGQALKRAISYADAEHVDCLSVVPQIATCGFVGDAVFDVSLALLSGNGRLRTVRDPKSRHVAATGAFILVRRSAFAKTPGFSWLRLEVADDFGLALMIKSHGGTCDILNGRGEVTLEWYSSFGEMTRLMQKNLFAIVAGFSLWRAIGVAALAAWLPLSLLAVTLPVHPTLRLIPLGGALCMTLATVLAARATGRSLLPALCWPIGFFGTAWMLLRSGVVGHRIGGIQWRGVVYPSAVLKAHQRVRM